MILFVALAFNIYVLIPECTCSRFWSNALRHSLKRGNIMSTEGLDVQNPVGDLLSQPVEISTAIANSMIHAFQNWKTILVSYKIHAKNKT